MHKQPFERSFSDCLEQANQGDLEAQFELGVRYEEGIGVDKNDGKAYWWYEMAASCGHSEAAARLARPDDSVVACWSRYCAERTLPLIGPIIICGPPPMPPSIIMPEAKLLYSLSSIACKKTYRTLFKKGKSDPDNAGS